MLWVSSEAMPLCALTMGNSMMRLVKRIISTCCLEAGQSEHVLMSIRVQDLPAQPIAVPLWDTTLHMNSNKLRALFCKQVMFPSRDAAVDVCSCSAVPTFAG